MNSENIMTDLEAIQNDLYPKATLEGSYITAENTVEGLRGVVSADEETEVTVCNKNLFNYLEKTNVGTRDGLTISLDKETGYVTVNGTPTINYANIVNKFDITNILEDGETYTLWQERHSDDSTSGIYLQIVQTDVEGSTSQIYASKENTTITIDKSKYTYTINLQSGTTTTAGTLEDYKNRYMLYKGTEESDYVLPKSKTYTVSDKTEIRTYDDITHIYNTDDVNMTVEVRERKE